LKHIAVGFSPLSFRCFLKSQILSAPTRTQW